jgi:hypothetical protein
MTLTIQLSDEQATTLQAKATAEGLSSVEAWIKKQAEPEGVPCKPRRHISETIHENMSRVPAEIMAAMPTAEARKPLAARIRDIWADMPDEVRAKLPTDGASQHDHYIYGVPKRAE